MIRSMIDVEEYLAQLSVVRKDYSSRLTTVRRVLTMLGSPQDAIPAIHIAGTSGKGSTAYYAARLLNDAGYTTGLVVSPHVNSVAERSQVNGEVLPESTYCRYFEQFVSVTIGHGLRLSYIEFLTVFAYWLFSELELEYIVIEVGLGGRLDPTNVITRPDTLRVIADISLDHTEILGNRLAEITSEKAGIIHSGDTVAMHRQVDEIMRTVADTVASSDATLLVEYDDTVRDSPLPAFLQRNWTLARRVVKERLALDSRAYVTDVVANKSLTLTIPGRFEYFRHDDVDIIIDAAHNPQKMSALAAGIVSVHPGRRTVWVVAFGGNKSVSVVESLRAIHLVATKIVATEFAMSDGMTRGAVPAHELARGAIRAGFREETIIVETKQHVALETAIGVAKRDDAIIVVTGSFYLIDGIRRVLLQDTETA